jgi:hypothetical protein
MRRRANAFNCHPDNDTGNLGTEPLSSNGRPLGFRYSGFQRHATICCWPWRGPTPLGLATTFYCLRFETSLFVASYDSQGHGGGIRPRLHTGVSHKSKSKLCYDRQFSLPVCLGIKHPYDQIFITVRQLQTC